MKLFDFRRNLKSDPANQTIVSEIDYIIASVLDVSVTNLALTDSISEQDVERVVSVVKRRLSHEPLDIIMGEEYFYGRTFCVSGEVLSPRPETELLVERAVGYIRGGGIKSVLDLCTGSGCIGITINLETGVEVLASDISDNALEIAKRNNEKLGSNVKFVFSDMFDRINGEFDLIVSNPPYIVSDDMPSLDEEVRSFDPEIALDGGADGLDFYRIIASKAFKHLTPGGLVILEIGENQAEDIRRIFENYTFVDSVFDYNNTERILVFRRK